MLNKFHQNIYKKRKKLVSYRLEKVLHTPKLNSAINKPSFSVHTEHINHLLSLRKCCIAKKNVLLIFYCLSIPALDSTFIAYDYDDDLLHTH